MRQCGRHTAAPCRRIAGCAVRLDHGMRDEGSLLAICVLDHDQYGINRGNWVIYFPNAIGALIGLIELAAYAYVRQTTRSLLPISVDVSALNERRGQGLGMGQMMGPGQGQGQGQGQGMETDAGGGEGEDPRAFMPRHSLDLDAALSASAGGR